MSRFFRHTRRSARYFEMHSTSAPARRFCLPLSSRRGVFGLIFSCSANAGRSHLRIRFWGRFSFSRTRQHSFSSLLTRNRFFLWHSLASSIGAPRRVARRKYWRLPTEL